MLYYKHFSKKSADLIFAMGSAVLSECCGIAVCSLWAKISYFFFKRSRISASNCSCVGPAGGASALGALTLL